MSNEDDRRHVSTLIWGYAASHIIGVSTRWRVFDRIGDTERDGAELAHDLDLPAGPLTRLLRAAAALGLLAEATPGRFRLTPTGALLRADQPNSLFDMAKMLTDPLLTDGWARLDASVRTGETAFAGIFGTDFFEHISENPELNEIFRSGMTSSTANVAPGLAAACDYGRFGTVVDVGGGSGLMLARILAANPDTRGVLFDTPAGLAGAPGVLAEAEVADRCTIVTGDFFREVPSGADAYLLKTIVHDWDDEPAAAILATCRKAIPDHGRLLIADRTLPETVDPTRSSLPYMMDLNMMVNYGGRERTRSDVERLCATAGFRVVDEHFAQGTDFTIIEAVPVPNG